MKKIISISLVIVLVFGGCSKKISNDNNVQVINKKIVTFTDEKFHFSVDYPQKWKHNIIDTYNANEEHEGTPDSGIEIFIKDNIDEKIYVFGQIGHISIPDINDYEIEEITTSSGLKGVLYKSKDKDVIDIRFLLKDEFIGAVIIMKNETYTENSEDIMNIIKSIRK